MLADMSDSRSIPTLTRGAAAFAVMAGTALLLSACAETGPTVHACPDAYVDLYENRGVEVSVPLAAELSGAELPEPSCSFTWSPRENEQVSTDIWVLGEASDAPALFETVTSALVASDWDLYMEQSETQWMLLPAGSEPASPRLIVSVLEPRQLAEYGLYENETVVVATRIED